MQRKITLSHGQSGLRWADENQKVNMMREHEPHLEFITSPPSLLCHSGAPTLAPSSPWTTCRSAVDCLFPLVLCRDLRRCHPAVQNQHHSVSLRSREHDFARSTNFAAGQ